MRLSPHSDSFITLSIRRPGLVAALSAIPMYCFFNLLLVYVVDVPWFDDIDAFLSFIIGYIDAPTVAQKFDWLIRPNNEHRILTGKLITLLMYKLTGVVSFRWLIIVAFLFLLALLALFYRVFQSMSLPLAAFVPVPFLLLQPQHYLSSMWAITAMQHEVVVMLSFLMIYLLAGNTPGRFAGALGVQILVSLSMSNGLFGWVAGAVVLALQRQWLRLSSWLVVGVGTIIFYFHDFPDGQGNESSVSYFLEHPHLIFFGFFTFSGGLFDLFPEASILWRSMLPTLAGLGLILLMLYWLWQMNKPLLSRPIGQHIPASQATSALLKRRYFFTGGYVFLMVNAVIVAFLRPRFGYEVMLISNYMLYPALLVIVLYLNGLSEGAIRTDFPLNRWVTIVLLVSVGVWANWYLVNLPKIAYRKHQLLTYAFNQKHNKTGLGPNWGSPFRQLADNAFTQTVKRGIYRYPDAYYSPFETKLLRAESILPDTTLHLRLLEGDYSYLGLAGFNSPPISSGPAAVVIQSAQRTYLFPSDWPFTFTNFYLNRPVWAVEGEIIIPMIAPGQYRVGIFMPSDTAQPIRFSSETLTVSK